MSNPSGRPPGPVGLFARKYGLSRAVAYDLELHKPGPDGRPRSQSMSDLAIQVLINSLSWDAVIKTNPREKRPFPKWKSGGRRSRRAIIPSMAAPSHKDESQIPNKQEA